MNKIFLGSLLIAGFMASPAMAEIATFQDALVSAYKNNPGLEANRQELKARDEKVAQAISGFRPSVTLSGEKGRERSSLADANYSIGDSDSRAVQVTQPIFSGFGSVNSVRLAEAQVEAQRASLLGSEQDILVAAATAFADIIRTRKLVELGKKQEEVLARHLQATRDRFSVGEVTRTDVAQAESRLATSTSDRVQAEANAAIAEANFERITRDKAAVELSQDLPMVDVPDSVDDAINLAQESNPALLQRISSEEAAEHNIGVQRSQLLPNLSLQGSSERIKGNRLGGSKYRDDSVVLSLKVPLYDSGIAFSKTREADSQHEQAKFETTDTANRVREAVIKGWEQWQASLISIESSQAAVTAAETALNGVEQEYLYGTRTTLDVLDTEQELFQTQVSLITAMRNEVVAKFNLAALIGRFNAKNLSLPVEVYNPEEHYNNTKYKMLGL